MVLHVRVVTGCGGGPEKTILRSASYASAMGLRMAAAYIHPHNDRGIDTLTAQADELGCPILTIPESGPLDPRTITSLLRACRALDVRIWHGHDYKSNLIGLVLSRVWPMKLVTTAHGWTRETRRTRLYARIDEWCLTKYDQVVTVSKRLHDHCAGLGVPATQRTLIHNGIDVDEYTRRRTTAAAKQSLSIPLTSPVIGVVGRLSHEKGVDRALRMFAAVRDEHTGAQLHLVGHGPEGDSLKALASDLGISDSVRFWGWRQDAASLLEAMDLLLLPSRTEGLPNALLEAMAMGVPCAAAEVGAVRHVLESGQCGLILDQDDQSWAAAISDLLCKPGHMRTYAQNAHRRVEDHFSFDHRMAKMRNVYDQAMGRTRHTDIQPARRAA